MEWRVERFPILASTNDMALARLRSGAARPGDVVVAEEQVSGRGRLGRAWHSPRGALLCTVILPFTPERAGWTSLAAGVATASAVRELGAPAGVKWPNDVVLNGGKLAGILAEAPVPGLVAVGVGMNVTNPLPEEARLLGRASRLADAVPEVTVSAALDALLGSLASTWALLDQPDLALLRAAWERLDTTVGRRLLWSEGHLTGTAVGLDDSGALFLRSDDGALHTARVGEVTFLER